MRFADNTEGLVKFMQIEVGMGIIPCGGGTQRIPRNTAKGRAMEIILGAQDFTAATAELYGTINRALPPGTKPDELSGYVDSLANRIAQFPPEAINAAKKAVTAAYSGISIEEGLEVEQYQASITLATGPTNARFEFAANPNGQTMGTCPEGPAKYNGQGCLKFQETLNDGVMLLQGIQERPQRWG
jgi:enoyl-CoA hydratase/carnithine racemase